MDQTIGPFLDGVRRPKPFPVSRAGSFLRPPWPFLIRSKILSTLSRDIERLALRREAPWGRCCYQDHTVRINPLCHSTVDIESRILNIE